MIRVKKVYAKLIDTLTIEEAPEEKNGIIGFNHNKELCIESGYKPVKFITDVDGTWKTYSETDTEIQEANFTFDDDVYKDRVILLIREKYSTEDEQAILRKKIAGIDNSSFISFNSFCEFCKKQAKLEQLV